MVVRTMEVSLSSAQRRNFAIALAVLPILLAIFAIVYALAGSLDHRARLATLVRERMMYETLLADLPKRRAAISAMNSSGMAAEFFPERQATAMANDVQRDMSTVLNGAGVAIGETTVRVTSDPQMPITAVSEHVMFAGDITQLSQILYRLDQMRPALFVDHLGVYGHNGGSPALGANKLNVDITVSAYMRRQQ